MTRSFFGGSGVEAAHVVQLGISSSGFECRFRVCAWQSPVRWLTGHAALVFP